ncbi:MAG: ankyrin repeat domain-containing protein [Gemmatimonadales bacterium]
MPRLLTPRSSLESLKREAKRWLTALRENVADARARLHRALPDAPAIPTLRDVQHALAREFGLPGWTALKDQVAQLVRIAHVEADAPAEPTLDELVARFLDLACPDHHVRGLPDHARARHTAMRLLERYPEIAGANFCTQVVCGDLAAVERALADRPELASLKSGEPSRARSGSGGSGDMFKDIGPKDLDPLSYLCFTRLPLPTVSENAVAIARALLDRGANPNVHFMAGGSRYTPLVGVIGEGEEDRPPHPQRDALARLLLERGAEPYDNQVTYNVGFHGRMLWWLELIYARSLELGRKGDWDDPEWPMLDMGGYGSGARWYLEMAIKHDDAALAEWCLAHGANPNAAPASDKRRPKFSLYEMAVRRGRTAIAELLVRHDAMATPVVLEGMDAFVAACLRLDHENVRAQVAHRPEYLRETAAIFAATKQDRADVVALLLDLGVSPDVENEHKERPLHIAGYSNALRVAELLIARGAEIDPRERHWWNTPLGCAVHYEHSAMIALLGRHSRDVWELTFTGNVERLREVLREEPERARVVADGETPLMWLPPDDEARTIEVVTLLLAAGADASVRNKDGATAAQRAERLGMFEVAALLRRAAKPQGPRPTLDEYERKAACLLEAYDTGTSEAMRRHWNETWHQRSWDAMKRYVLADLGKRPAAEGEHVAITLDDARTLVAREHGFRTWPALAEYVATLPVDKRAIAAKPVTLFGPTGEDEHTRDWDAAIELMRAKRLTGLDARNQMTDAVLDRVSRVEHLTTLRLGGSKALTDDGIRHLARMRELRHLDLSGTQVTDRGLEALRELPALESVFLAWTHVTDAGVAAFSRARHLQRVDLTGTRTGDGAVQSLAGKPGLSHFRSGALLTDAGVPFLHGFPVFKAWQGGEESFALVSPGVEPNSLMLRGAITDRGLAALAGLDGLFGLNVDDSALAVTAAGLAPLVTLPHLGHLAFDATDDAMPYIAAMPRLRFLMCQDTVAGDDGFVALARSQSIENIWGRHCHNLRSRGFAALSTMHSLRALSVSCKNVGDEALATLPRFPALRELMPMDVPDEGYRHIGRCEQLEALILMYCRETTDVATEHIAALPRLRKYFASYNLITDRTPELLSGIASLEDVGFDTCVALTDRGVSALARLPRLRELSLGGMPRVTPEIVAAFPGSVRVRYSP